MSLHKIHLRTACGCTKTFLQPNTPVSNIFCVPISATYIAAREPGITPTESWSKRVFELVKIHSRSKQRTELWYEEVVNA